MITPTPKHGLLDVRGVFSHDVGASVRSRLISNSQWCQTVPRGWDVMDSKDRGMRKGVGSSLWRESYAALHLRSVARALPLRRESLGVAPDSHILSERPFYSIRKEGGSSRAGCSRQWRDGYLLALQWPAARGDFAARRRHGAWRFDTVYGVELSCPHHIGPLAMQARMT